MSIGFDQRKLKALESYRLNALVTLLINLFPTHPIHQNLKEKLQQSKDSFSDGLIETNILATIKIKIKSDQNILKNRFIMANLLKTLI